ncbi:hypothetical protein A3Q56_04856 [Intoshia linei]|uniref:RRM domain-containing protein n=1 Tax=Intoshia linei TaxID=1819745 RepID=A0A177AZK7_9BILA|nr:hypothetical protein A3Q56_04856 [Intoshia linei]
MKASLNRYRNNKRRIGDKTSQIQQKRIILGSNHINRSYEKRQNNSNNVTNNQFVERVYYRRRPLTVSPNVSYQVRQEVGKLLVENLHFGINDEDIKEIFSEFGVRKFSVNYNKMGRSMGNAEVHFFNMKSAVGARNKFNNVLLDGRKMKLTIINERLTNSINTSTYQRRSFTNVKRLSNGPRWNFPNRNKGRLNFNKFNQGRFKSKQMYGYNNSYKVYYMLSKLKISNLMTRRCLFETFKPPIIKTNIYSKMLLVLSGRYRSIKSVPTEMELYDFNRWINKTNHHVNTIVIFSVVLIFIPYIMRISRKATELTKRNREAYHLDNC